MPGGGAPARSKARSSASVAGGRGSCRRPCWAEGWVDRSTSSGSAVVEVGLDWSGGASIRGHCRQRNEDSTSGQERGGYTDLVNSVALRGW